MNKIKYNIPYTPKIVAKNILDVVKNKKFADGLIRNKTETFLGKMLNSKNIILTQSCTSALEACISICDIGINDEVILPSYTFTSTANCILMNKAKPIFADIDSKTLNLDPEDVEKRITKKTKAIILVHYNGLPCNMHEFIKLKKKYKLFLIEDCAHALSAKYKKKFLGTIGDLGTFSFHETKNFPAGQGGALCVNNKKLIKKATIYCDKGTNRSFMGKNSYYSWKGVGSEIRATEMTSALILSQLKYSKIIQKKREKIWNIYSKSLGKINQKLFYFQKKNYRHFENAYHLFPIIFYKKSIRLKFTQFMNLKKIECFFHYYPLHLSSFGKKYCKNKLINTEKVYNGLIRLPLYPDLKIKSLKKILKEISIFVRFNS
tara:strand:+ start:1391 stop:2518 length:1128 start_codon:yes stop_codon:yes gene_type:complete